MVASSLNDCRVEHEAPLFVCYYCQSQWIIPVNKHQFCRWFLKSEDSISSHPFFPVCCVFHDERIELDHAYLVTASLEIEDINELAKATNGPLSELLLKSLFLLL